MPNELPASRPIKEVLLDPVREIARQAIDEFKREILPRIEALEADKLKREED